MSYRDELDAARARADALERELSDARAEIAELKGETALATVDRGALAVREGDALTRTSASGPAVTRWLAGPTRIHGERVVDGELPESAYTEIVEVIRRVVGEAGTTSTLPGSLSWTSTAAQGTVGPHMSIYLTARDGVTTIRGDEKLGQLAGAIFGGVGGGVGGGGVMLPIAAAWVNPLLLAVTIPAWLGATYWSCRKLYRNRASARAERLEEVLDWVARTAEAAIARARASEGKRESDGAS